MANSKSFVFDYQSGEYGWNESAERGADTFHPFSSKTDLLWSNPNPSSAFGGQKIILDLSKYGAVIIEFRYHANFLPFPYAFTFMKPFPLTDGQHYNGNYYNCVVIPGNAMSGGVYRSVTQVADSGVTFGGGGYFGGDGPHGSDQYCVPLNIWGIKNGYLQ